MRWRKWLRIKDMCMWRRGGWAVWLGVGDMDKVQVGDVTYFSKLGLGTKAGVRFRNRVYYTLYQL